jgi:flagellar hook-length control protein FliK
VQPQAVTTTSQNASGGEETSGAAKNAGALGLGALTAQQSEQSGSAKTLKMAASSNTVSAQAGLKPWNKDWVFEGQSELANAGEEATSKPVQSEATQGMPPQSGPTAANTVASAPLNGASSKGVTAKIEWSGEKRGEADEAGLSARTQGFQGASQAFKKPGSPQASAATGNSPLNEMPEAAQDGSAMSVESMNAQLAAMGGVLQGYSSGSSEAKPASAGKGESQSKSSVSKLGGGLSGSDFLSTLGVVQGGAQQTALRPAQGNGQFSGQNDGRDGNAQGGNGGKANLRVVSGSEALKGKPKSAFATIEEQLQSGSRAADQTMAQSFGVAGGAGTQIMGRTPTEVTGHVVQGANAEERLSSEALLGMSNGIRGFAGIGAGQGAGEMRIRLKPENLGELHVRVMTDGKSVGLQFQASDERAKKIIEESMGSLKDSLAAQNLSLGSVDFSVSQSQQGSASNNDSNRHDNQNNQAQQQSLGFGQQGMQGQSGGRSGQGGWDGMGGEGDFESGGIGGVRSARSGGARAMSAAASGSMAAQARSQASAGRLDVRA